MKLSDKPLSLWTRQDSGHFFAEAAEMLEHAAGLMWCDAPSPESCAQMQELAIVVAQKVIAAAHGNQDEFLRLNTFGLRLMETWGWNGHLPDPDDQEGEPTQ